MSPDADSLLFFYQLAFQNSSCFQPSYLVVLSRRNLLGPVSRSFFFWTTVWLMFLLWQLPSCQRTLEYQLNAILELDACRSAQLDKGWLNVVSAQEIQVHDTLQG